jgi:hypothetical protein
LGVRAERLKKQRSSFVPLSLFGNLVLLNQPIPNLTTSGKPVSTAHSRTNGAIFFAGFVSGTEDLNGIEVLTQIVQTSLDQGYVLIFALHLETTGSRSPAS